MKSAMKHEHKVSQTVTQDGKGYGIYSYTM